MSQVAIREEPRTSINSVAFGNSAGGGHLTPQNLGDIVRFAEVMSKADVAIPKHLRGNPGACLAVCMQAMKWEMDPFSVAQKSYKVGDLMAYEAQLIAAVINTRAGLKQRPQIDYDGEGADRVCVVTFNAVDGSTHVYRSPRFVLITPKNSPLWKSDPDQQQAYYSLRAGARRHFPEVILGVYDRDEIAEARDVTPVSEERSGFAARIASSGSPSSPTDAREGFSHSFIDAELDTRPEATLPAGNTNEADGVMSPDTEAREDDLPASEGSEDDVGGTDVVDAPPVAERLLAYAKDVLSLAGKAGSIEQRLGWLEKAQGRWGIELKAALTEPELKQATSIFKSAQAIAKDQADLDAAVSHYAGLLGVDEAEIVGAPDE